MCGITGIYNFSNKKIDENILLEMNNQMLSRGPDDGGIYLHENVGLAMRRLSIIDLDNGSQPIVDTNSEISIVFNGEIYNYIELRNQLIKDGFSFKTKSDTEVILKLYIKYGFSSVNYLNGMFSFAIFDKKKSLLWITRDRFGIKPLYYTYNKESFIFASTINAIKKHKIFNNNLSENSILTYLSLSYTGQQSIYGQVKKLNPGSQIIINHNKVKLSKYWDIDSIDQDKISDKKFIEKASYLLNDSIKIQSRSDVEVGSFLSGGIDSSAITAIHKKNINQQFHTFSMTFDKKIMKDNYYAELLSKKIGTKHHAYELNYQDGFDNLHELLRTFDEPIGDSAIIPSYYLSKKAKEHNIKVMLSGAGGDEIFGGYRRYFKNLRDIVSGSLDFLPINFSILLAKLGAIKSSQICFSLGNENAAYGSSLSGINFAVLSILFKKDIIHKIMKNFQNSNMENLYKNKNFSYERMKFDTKNYLVDDILSLTDKASMASSVEVRVPFLDNRLVEHIYGSSNLSQNLKKVSDSKIFLKKILEDTLPSQILNRKKEGFNCPIPIWVYEDSKNNQYIKNRLMNMSCDFLKNNFNKLAFEKIYNNKKLLLKSAETLFLIYTLDFWFEYNN